MKKGTCKHFNGSMLHLYCRAGVSYALVNGRPAEMNGFAMRLPCVRYTQQEQIEKWTVGQLKAYSERGKCEKFCEPTDEEIAKYEEQINQDSKLYRASIVLASRIRLYHSGENWSGKMDCPVCKGKVSVSISASNDHTRGKCETKDCLQWIE